ncbi:DNA polymerase alpha subunit B-like protein [Drosera capensis]
MEAQIKAEFEHGGFSVDDDALLLNKYYVLYQLQAHAVGVGVELGSLLSQQIYGELFRGDDIYEVESLWKIGLIYDEVWILEGNARLGERNLKDPTVTNAEMDGFLLYLQNEQKEAFIKEETNLHVYSIHDVDMILNAEREDMKENFPDTPGDRPHNHLVESPHVATQANGGTSSHAKSSSLVTPFGQRTNKFVVHSEFNKLSVENKLRVPQETSCEDDIISKVQPGKRCSLVVQGSRPVPGCRFMYDRLDDKFDHLEQRIQRYASTLVSSGGNDGLVDPTVASPQSIFAVGMVFCDGEGHLNENSVLLQSSVEHSGGQRVRVDLGKLSHYSVFPGQVVGMVGNNPSGHCFVASEIVDSVLFPISTDENLHPAKRQALEPESPITDQSEPAKLSLIVAAGPFTTTDNLLFEPLAELLAYATRKQPQLLILLGPFVDSEHPEIKKATFDRSFDEIFHQEIFRKLQDHVEYMGSAVRVVLAPSIRDANHDFVFPQPPFSISSADLKSQDRIVIVLHISAQIISLTNPGVFYANEVRIGCCTVDILKQLSGEEISRYPKGGSAGDRVGRLATHIINQHSFYPLYPPAEGVPMDFSIAPEALDIMSVPNILILPSDLSPFMKVLSAKGNDELKQQINCICVNPGRLSKGVGGGTFVELNYHGSPETTEVSIIRL